MAELCVPGLQRGLGVAQRGDVEGDPADPDAALQVDCELVGLPHLRRRGGDRHPLLDPEQAVGSSLRIVPRARVGERLWKPVVIHLPEHFGGGAVEHRLELAIHVAHSPVGVFQERDGGGVVEECDELTLALRVTGRLEARFHQGRRLLGQGDERRLLPSVHLTRPEVDSADRPDGLTLHHNGRARIESNPRLTRYEGVVREARVERRVRDHQRLRPKDRLGAEGDVARGLAPIDPSPGFEPLPVSTDERHECDRHVEDRLRDLYKTVELPLGRRVEEFEGPEGRESSLLKRGDGSGHGSFIAWSSVFLKARTRPCRRNIGASLL